MKRALAAVFAALIIYPLCELLWRIMPAHKFKAMAPLSWPGGGR